MGGGLAEAGAVPTGYLYRAQGTLHVDYPGVDGHIHEYWQDGVGLAPQRPDRATGVLPSRSNPSAYELSADNTHHVVFVDDNRHVVELY